MLTLAIMGWVFVAVLALVAWNYRSRAKHCYEAVEEQRSETMKEYSRALKWSYRATDLELQLMTRVAESKQLKADHDMALEQSRHEVRALRHAVDALNETMAKGEKDSC